MSDKFHDHAQRTIEYISEAEQKTPADLLYPAAYGILKGYIYTMLSDMSDMLTVEQAFDVFEVLFALDKLVHEFEELPL